MRGHNVYVLRVPTISLKRYPWLTLPPSGKQWFQVRVVNIQTDDTITGFRLGSESEEVRVWARRLATEGRLSVLASTNYLDRQAPVIV